MLKAYSWLTFCVIVWGSNFVFGKILVQYFSPTVLTLFRLVFIVLLLVGLAVYQKQFQPLPKTAIPTIIFLGIVGVFINQWSFFVGLQTADSTTSALILALTPILAGFLAAIFLKEKLTIKMGIGSVVAIIGIFIVVTKGNFTTVAVDKGLIWIVLTMVTFAIMIILTRVLAQRIEPLAITLYSNIVALIIAIPVTFLWDKPIIVSTNFSMWALLIGTAIVVHGIATLIWNQNIRHVDASKAAILSNLEPFIAMIMGLIILLKPITMLEIIGSIFIVGGVILSTYQRKELE